MEKTNFLYYDRLMIEYKETKHSLVYKANSDLSLYSAGYEECTPGYSYGLMHGSALSASARKAISIRL